MANIAKITLPNGSNEVTYEIEDAVARNSINQLQQNLAKNIIYRGKTTSTITDGSSLRTIQIEGEEDPLDVEAGDVVICERTINDRVVPIEFIFNGNIWNEFGPGGALGTLAFKSSVTTNYTPSGTIEVNNLSGSPTTVTSYFIPSGTVSASFTGDPATIDVSSEVSGSVSINYTPVGTISTPAFQGTQQSLTIYPIAGESTYTPGGSVSTPTVTVIPTTSVIHQFSTAGTLPQFNMEVEDQVLSFEWDAGSLPTFEDEEVVVGIQSVNVSQPVFTGTPTRLGTNYTPSGTISSLTFTGTQAILRGTLSGGVATTTWNYTPSGTISASFNGRQTSIESSFTPQISVDQITFRGETTTITSS